LNFLLALMNPGLCGLPARTYRERYKVGRLTSFRWRYATFSLITSFRSRCAKFCGYQLPLAPPPPELPPPKPPKPPPPPNPPPPPQPPPLHDPPPRRPPLFMNMPSKNQIRPPPPALNRTETTISTITIPRRMTPAGGPFEGSSGGGRDASAPSSCMPASAAITPATRCVMSSKAGPYRFCLSNGTASRPKPPTFPSGRIGS